MTLRSIFAALDFWVAVLLATVTGILLPRWVRTDFVKDLYGIAIGVLSIIFSVFFAALAVIMASSDDEFVEFLEKESDYTGIIETMKFTLIILFTALAAALALYSYTAYRISVRIEYQRFLWLMAYSFLFSYALAASLSATLDAIKYSKYRATYLSLHLRKKCADKS